MFLYTQVNKENCLSPGTVTSRRGIELNNKGKKWIKHDETKEAQRRRIQLKEERSTRQYQTKVREGDTYESDIGLWHSSDIQEIRCPVTTPQNQNLMTVISTTKIMFDVGKTSLGNTCLYQFQSMFFYNCISPFSPRKTIIKFVLTIFSGGLEVPFLHCIVMTWYHRHQLPDFFGIV